MASTRRDVRAERQAQTKQEVKRGGRVLGREVEGALDGDAADFELLGQLDLERLLEIPRSLGYAVDREETSERGVTVHMVKTIDAETRRLLFLPGAGADPAFWRPLGDRLPASWRFACSSA